MVELLGPSASPRPDDLPRRHSWADVPWRTIIATVGVVVATAAAIALVAITLRIVIWVVIAGFFAIVLAPAVARVQRRVRGAGDKGVRAVPQRLHGSGHRKQELNLGV